MTRDRSHCFVRAPPHPNSREIGIWHLFRNTYIENLEAGLLIGMELRTVVLLPSSLTIDGAGRGNRDAEVALYCRAIPLQRRRPLHMMRRSTGQEGQLEVRHLEIVPS